MSILGAVALAAGTVENHLVTIIPKRSFGPIQANIVVRESHADRLMITQHPVQQGAKISDHAVKLPAELTLYMGWSNSGLKGQFDGVTSGDFSSLSSFSAIGAGLKGLLNGNYVNQVYDKLLTLQTDRTPMTIVTGKRRYENMLIESLETTTDQTTEHSLLVVAHCKQIILVSYQTVVVPPNAVHKFPEKTGAVTQSGVQSATPALTFNQLQAATAAGGP